MPNHLTRFITPTLVCVSAMSANAQTPSEGLSITAKNGQSFEQQAADRYQCHSWASEQTGFDSTKPGAGVAAGEFAARRVEYQRAMTACLEARGYSVSAAVAAPAPFAPPPPPPPPPPQAPAPPRYVVPAYPPPAPAATPQLKYHPLQIQIEGGYSIAAGTTNQDLNGGGNVGLGLTWNPTPALPVGVRVDGSYSWFDDRGQQLAGTGYNVGHDDFYGGDADLQLDLAHRSSRAKVYLFGGVGWYRDSAERKTISFVNGTICYWYWCGPGTFPAVTAVERYTSDWHDAWNAGVGWETAIAADRYLRIKPNEADLQFVPIRIGLRF